MTERIGRGTNKTRLIVGAFAALAAGVWCAGESSSSSSEQDEVAPGFLVAPEMQEYVSDRKKVFTDIVPRFLGRKKLWYQKCGFAAKSRHRVILNVHFTTREYDDSTPREEWTLGLKKCLQSVDAEIDVSVVVLVNHRLMAYPQPTGGLVEPKEKPVKESSASLYEQQAMAGEALTDPSQVPRTDIATFFDCLAESLAAQGGNDAHRKRTLFLDSALRWLDGISEQLAKLQRSVATSNLRIVIPFHSGQNVLYNEQSATVYLAPHRWMRPQVNTLYYTDAASQKTYVLLGDVYAYNLHTELFYENPAHAGGEGSVAEHVLVEVRIYHNVRKPEGPLSFGGGQTANLIFIQDALGVLQQKDIPRLLILPSKRRADMGIVVVPYLIARKHGFTVGYMEIADLGESTLKVLFEECFDKEQKPLAKAAINIARFAWTDVPHEMTKRGLGSEEMLSMHGGTINTLVIRLGSGTNTLCIGKAMSTFIRFLKIEGDILKLCRGCRGFNGSLCSLMKALPLVQTLEAGIRIQEYVEYVSNTYNLPEGVVVKDISDRTFEEGQWVYTVRTEVAEGSPQPTLTIAKRHRATITHNLPQEQPAKATSKEEPEKETEYD